MIGLECQNAAAEESKMARFEGKTHGFRSYMSDLVPIQGIAADLI